jgi:multiple sugar transport system ATP-binding protein
MAAVELSGVKKSFGAVSILQGIDLTVKHGEFVVFVGPSGCGKSTLLRLIAGLETVSDGTVKIDGEDVTRKAPAKRGVAMVFQSYALFPHMTVAENISFGLRLAGQPREEIDRQVNRVAETLQLTPLLQRRPKQLSGGQRQRVAIGRAIIRNPKVFLFDEPLSNLDAALRSQMRIEIAKLHEDLQATMIYVTHDQVEAMTLADRIVVLNGGKIEQIGTPMELYAKPQNRFVAGFIGSPKMNFITGEHVRKGKLAAVQLAEAVFPITVTDNRIEGKNISLGFRPEDISLEKAGRVALGNGSLVVQERLGSETLGYYQFNGMDDLLVMKHDRSVDLQRGKPVMIYAKPEAAHLFNDKGRRID